MIKNLLDRLSAAVGTPQGPDETDENRAASLRLATAVLMVDVARADHVFEESELERVLQLIESHFQLDPQDAADLFNHASEKAKEMVSAYDFTSTLHSYLNDTEKERIVGLLWQVAYADGQLDKYEDSLVLKISDLLYVNRTRVMRLKSDAKLAVT